MASWSRFSLGSKIRFQSSVYQCSPYHLLSGEENRREENIWMPKTVHSQKSKVCESFLPELGLRGGYKNQPFI